MSITTEVKLESIRMPNYAIHQVASEKPGDRFSAAPKTHINDLPLETVVALCDDFKSRMVERWKKANNDQSPEATP